MKFAILYIFVGLVVASVIIGVGVIEAQPRRPFNAYQSGGNCVYIADGKYANFIAVVPVGSSGC